MCTYGNISEYGLSLDIHVERNKTKCFSRSAQKCNKQIRLMQLDQNMCKRVLKLHQHLYHETG